MRNCPTEVNVSLGDFTSMDAGNRASIQRLSKEVCRCPKAYKYRIFWKVTSEGEEIDRRAALYERQKQVTGMGRVGYEIDPYSGFWSKVHTVNDNAIHAVAHKGGTFEDFTEYDQKVK